MDLYIKGGVFTDTVRLQNLLTKRMNIVYGRNGSGKSTIARSFREQQPDRQAINPRRYYQLSFDDSGNLPADTCNHLFVFNEDFIDDNIKFKDSLKSIIRIGASAELDAPIQEAKNHISKLKEQKVRIQDELDTLNGTPTTKGSIKEADKEIKENMKKQGGYADRLNKIDGKQNLVSSVLNPVLCFNRGDVLPISISEAAKKLDKDIIRFHSFQSGSPLSWCPPSLSPLPDLNVINGILSQSVRPAELSSEEDAILADISQALAGEHFMEKTETIIISSSRQYCPLCHQHINNDHKQTLKDRLVKFRNETVENFKDSVIQMNASVQEFRIVLPLFPSTDYDDDLAEANQKVKELNDFISDIKVALDNKIKNPYSAMQGFDKSELNTIVNECSVALTRISDDVNAYNQTFAEKDALKTSINKENIRLAYHENKVWIDCYNDRLAEREKLEADLNNLDTEIGKQNILINSLNAQVDQVDDAREQINHYLEIIFAGKKLQLVPAGKDQYKLQIKQGDYYRDIPTKAISSGERNALALAYFFACVMEKKDKNYNYSDPTLLIIDDPVSSFDSDNKAGVLSLLSDQIRKILKGNRESKVMVFTHDFTTLRELCSQRKRLFSDNDYETSTFTILRPSHKIKEESCTRILENMEYGNDLWTIFKFADFDDPEEFDSFDSIGNTIRSFAESYASRMFKCPWNDLFTDDKRLERIPDNIRDKFKAFEIRSVLNSESHGVESAYEPVEIRRAARILLVYLYYASYDHLYAYLVGRQTSNEWRMGKIESWVDEF